MEVILRHNEAGSGLELDAVELEVIFGLPGYKSRWGKMISVLEHEAPIFVK